MKTIQFDVGHPAHVHLFKNAAKTLENSGYRVIWSALDREMIIELLESLSANFTVSYQRQGGRIHLLKEILPRTLKTLQIAYHNHSDVLISMVNPTVGLPAWLLGKPYIAITDTEPAHNQIKFAYPFASKVLTPDAFLTDLGAKHIRDHRYRTCP